MMQVKRACASAVMVIGLAAFGAGGVAGAAAGHSAHRAGIGGATQVHSSASQPRHFSCATAELHLKKVEAALTSGLPRLQQAELRAMAQGATARAAEIEQKITALEDKGLPSRASAIQARVQAQCR